MRGVGGGVGWAMLEARRAAVDKRGGRGSGGGVRNRGGGDGHLHRHVARDPRARVCDAVRTTPCICTRGTPFDEASYLKPKTP